MSVFIDSAANRSGRMIMCHMLADTPAELHAMADNIGVARCHYQSCVKASFPHYDICKSKRALAIRYGAIEISNQQLSAFMKKTRRTLIDQGKTWADAGWD